MSLVLPPFVPYQSPIPVLPTRWANCPPEGPKVVPIEINWGVQGGPADCIAIDVANARSADQFTQIVYMSIDNSQCSQDCVIVFPDTMETVPVAAMSAFRTPVTTNAVSFFIFVPNGAGASDVTRISVYNTMPPPVALPSSAVTTGLPLTPKVGDAYSIVSAGTAVIAIQGPANGGYIVNPLNATAQGIGAAENLYVSDVSAPGSTDATGNRSTDILVPGQSWTLPGPIGPGISVWVNAATAGHLFTSKKW